LVSGQGKVIGLDLLQSLDIEVLLSAEVAFDTGHVLDDEHLARLLMDVAGVFGAEASVAAKAALFGHVGVSLSRMGS
jgi:hypothetical protein